MLIDTHVFLGFVTSDRRIPSRLIRRIEDDPGRVSISSVSFWEVVMLGQRGAIELDRTDVGVWMKEKVSRVGLRIIPVDEEIAILSRTLAFDHNDPADRFIAATAFHLRIPLATIDNRLKKLPWLDIA